MIDINGTFEIGEYAHMGFDYKIQGNNIKIGDHFYHSHGLRVGGGGHNGPAANLTIGDRCVVHNCFINVCEPVIIGNDVGLSEEVTILTHGYWQNVLEGYPAKFAGVTIGDGVIVGYRSIILPGISIADDCVIGAGSVVTKSIYKKGIYGGNPAKFIKNIEPVPERERPFKALHIIHGYRHLCEFHGLDPTIEFNYPEVRVEDFTINLETLKFKGRETEQTDHFRDYMRKYGFRIYTERPF